MIYLDNAATTFPRPERVLMAMLRGYAEFGCSPNRGGYDAAVRVGDLVTAVRRKAARLFGLTDPDRVAFAANATDALNTAMLGLLRPGDHVAATRLEHNSVLRPLHHLKQRGWIEYDLVPFDGQGFIEPQGLARALRPNTRLVIVNHASNVLGTVQPIEEIGRVCRERGVLFLVDAAQSAGLIPIDMPAARVDILAFTGHKALLGPAGIGGLALGPGVEIEPSRFGGTGVDSHSLEHTRSLPHRLEAGTPNLPGIIGLGAGLDLLEEEGLERIREREMVLARALWDGLEGLSGIVLYGGRPSDRHVPVLSVAVRDKPASAVGEILDGDFDIAVRTGLHCAPLVHQDLGTAEQGTVRFSIGYMNTRADIDRVIEAMGRMAGSGKSR
ncbi:MAG: aminotransferase class V-fold PLP-dependent enzyme [Thermodesulfobacteriota bacterium]